MKQCSMASAVDRGGLKPYEFLSAAHHHAQDRALAFDGPVQPLELFGVRVAAGLAPKGLAFLGIGLFQCYACSLGCVHHLVAGDLQQPAVHRVGTPTSSA